MAPVRAFPLAMDRWISRVKGWLVARKIGLGFSEHNSGPASG